MTTRKLESVKDQIEREKNNLPITFRVLKYEEMSRSRYTNIKYIEVDTFQTNRYATEAHHKAISKPLEQNE